MMPARGWFASRIERASGQQGANRHRAGFMRKLQNQAPTATFLKLLGNPETSVTGKQQKKTTY